MGQLKKGVMTIKFYSVQTRQTVEVPDSEVEIVTMKNGKKAAKAQITKNGQILKLFKIVGSDDLKRLGQ